MFRTTATPSPEIGPVRPDWTTRELLEWIAEDDARSHDEALLGPLAAIDDALTARDRAEASALAPRSPTPLVRALARRLRDRPALRSVRLSDLVGFVAPGPAADGGDRRGVAAGRAAASVRAPRLAAAAAAAAHSR